MAKARPRRTIRHGFARMRMSLRRLARKAGGMTGFVEGNRLLLAGIIGVVTPALLLLSLYGFANKVDQQARERSEMLVQHGLERRIAEVSRSITPQAVWGEAVEHLQTFDPEWARQNVGEYFTKTNGFRLAAVADANGRIIFSMNDGSGVDQQLMTSSFEPMIDQIRRREAGLAPLAQRVQRGETLSNPVQATNIASIGGRSFVLGATLVQPDFDASLAKPGPAPIILTGQEIDQAFLANLKDDYQLDGLEIISTPARESETFSEVTLKDASGHPALSLRWKPRTPGANLLREALPYVLITMAVLAAIATTFHRRAQRALTGLIASERRSAHLAHHDTVTGLPNRTLFLERLAQAISTAKRSGRSFAVHCIDLDRFKDVNDAFGHHVGDDLIRYVGDMLSREIRAGDIVARFGGDEFSLLQLDCTPHQASMLAERLVAKLAEPIKLSVGRVFIGASVGVSYVDAASARDPQECLREADLALYRSKDGGRGRVTFFEPEMDAALRYRRALQNDLRDALNQEHLTMVYQPQVDGSNRVTGVEALMRWNHPVRGAISPAVFVPLAEECGLIDQLGWFALRQAFKDSSRWPNLKVGVNVSASQLRLKGFVDGVAQLVEEHGIDPRRFELEITEGLLLADTSDTHETLGVLRQMGFSIALDDFGTGYSSLSYLQRFPINRIKIDRSFVSNLGVESEAEEVVAAIVRLARALGMAVVAEGVETDGQRDRLAAAGCRDIQGYLASRPLDVNNVSSFIDRTPRRSAA